MFQPLGKLLILLGALILGVGVLITLLPKIPFLGKLPGDIFFQKKHFAFYFPVVTCIILSILLTVLLNLFSRK